MSFTSLKNKTGLRIKLHQLLTMYKIVKLTIDKIAKLTIDKIAKLTIDKIAIVDYVQDCKADIFAITETWLTQNDTVVCREITPAGYRLLHRPRADHIGGGTTLLYKESFNIRCW